MTPGERSDGVLAEDVNGIADQLELLGADEAAETLREAANRVAS